MLHGFTELALIEQRIAQVVVGSGVRRLEPQRLSKTFDGLIKFT
jgi:hypothetical protein